MGNKTISLRQLLSLLFAALFPLCTERLPSRTASAGGAGWLCPLLAGAAAIGILALLCRRPLLGQANLTEGKGWQTKPLTALFLLWTLFLASGHGARIGSRLSDALRASPVLLGLAVLALAAWMAAGGLPSFARACEIFALAVGAGFLLIAVFGVFRLRGEYLVLFSMEEVGAVPGRALSVLGTAAVGVCALFFLGDVTPEKGGRDILLRRTGGFFLMVSLSMLLVLGRFGPALTGKITRPFFQMASGLGLEGAFQRLEEVASALWLLGDGALLGLLLLTARRLAASLLGRQETAGQTWGLAGLAFLGSIPTGFWNGILAGDFLPFCNLLAGAVGLIWTAFSGISKKSKKLEKKG